MSFKTMLLFLKKEKGSVASVCGDNSPQPDLNTVIGQESSYFSSIFYITSLAVVDSHFSQRFYDIGDFWGGKLIKEAFV